MTQDDSPSNPKLVHAVNNIEYSFQLRYPPYLQITADGLANTSHSNRPALVAKDNPIADRVLQLDFVAEPAEAAQGDELVPVQAEITWKEGVDSLSGVKIFAATNQISKTFGEGSRK